jgi:hypothetical protein
MYECSHRQRPWYFLHNKLLTCPCPCPLTGTLGRDKMSKKAVKVTREFKGEKSLEEILKEYILQKMKRKSM